MKRKEEIINEAQELKNDTQFMLGFIEGAQWADKTMIEKACDWLESCADCYIDGNDDGAYYRMSDMIDDFKKAMMKE